MDFEEQNIQSAPNALEELSSSGYQIKEGQPDITAWNVLNRAGEKIGEVEDLLFDPQTQKVRYLIIQLQASGEDMDDDNKRVLVPIGVAELRTEQDEVALPVGPVDELAGLPAYESGQLKPEDEVQIRELFGGSSAPYEHPQFYAHAHFDDHQFSTRDGVTDKDSAARAERAGQIVERLQQSDEESKSTEFQTTGITTESLERENSQPVEETGTQDYPLAEGLIPEPESIEQEEAWQEELETGTGTSKLMEFFINELKDLLWAEKELVEVLPEMAEAATSAELKAAFNQHFTETETHVTRLKQVFAILGLEPESRKCEAISGILDEGDEIISVADEGTAQRDVGLIFAGQKAEHYEIASYGGMIALAKTLGYYDIAEIFVLTLDEEKTADAKLTEIAEGQANEAASKENADE